MAFPGLEGNAPHPSGKDWFFGRTALQPGVVRLLASLMNDCPCFSAVLFSTFHTDSGWKDARNWRAIKSYNLAASALIEPLGILPVGIIAKWSETFALSKFLFTFFRPSLTNLSECGFNLSCAPSLRIVFDISSIISSGRWRESVRGYVVNLWVSYNS